MIDVVPATREHMLAIVANPSKQMLKDMAAIGLPMDRVVDRFDLEDASTAVEDGVPIGAMGWDKLPGVWYCWSATTPQYYDPSRSATILMTRRYLRQLQSDNPGVSLLMVPRVPADERLVRWMGLLGFDWLPGEGIFIYKRPARVVA